MKFRELDRSKLLVLQFDLDGTLCTVEKGPRNLKDYANAIPRLDRIKKVNELHNEGHLIKIVTARGAQTDQDWEEFTKKQLVEWGLKYSVLKVGGGHKLHANYYIDDKGINADDFFA